MEKNLSEAHFWNNLPPDINFFRYPYHSFKDSFGSGQDYNVNVQCVSWFYDKVNHVLEITLYLIAILP